MATVRVIDHPFVPDDHGRCLHVEMPNGTYCNGREEVHMLVAKKNPFADPRSVHATDTIPAVQAWDAFAAQVRDTIIKKSQGYGNAWQAQGYIGNLARVLSKASRLKNLCWADDNPAEFPTPSEEGQETVQDTLHDLGALCAFTVANIEEGNRWGR